MPYKPEELQDVQFYQEFLAEPTRKFFDRVARSAANRDDNGNPTPFRKTGVDFVSFEDITTGLGLEEANFSDYAYNLLVSSIDSRELNYFLNILNEEGGLVDSMMLEQLESIGAQFISAGSGTESDFQAGPEATPIAIRSLLDSASEKKRENYPNYKDSKLENVINRNINELSKSLVAETLPEGVNNGNIITSDSVDDTRKWLIENNQKRVFPTLSTFWGSAYAFSELVTLSISDINNIPDGDPID